MNDSNSFTGVFTAIYKDLNIKYDILANKNHKGLLVEKFNCFINKIIIMVAEDKGTKYILLVTDVTIGYAWNSSPSDGTDIHRSVPTTGREFRSPLILI